MLEISPHARARLLFNLAALAYDFGPHHPMQPRRLEALIDLLETSGLWRQDDEQTCLGGRVARPEELCLLNACELRADSVPLHAFLSVSMHCF